MNLLPLEDINFGSVAAEHDVTAKDGMFLLDAFEDPFDVISKITKDGKIFILGRKGCGKTHIKEILASRSEWNQITKSLPYKATDLEKAIQKIDTEAISSQQLCEWLFLCNLAELLLKDKRICEMENTKEIKSIEEFLKIHRGYVSPNAFEIKEAIIKNSSEVKFAILKPALVSYLKRKGFDFKGEKAPFYKVAPVLKEILKELIKKADPESRFYIMVDDIDEDFTGSEAQVEMLSGMLRAARDLTLEFRNQTSAHVSLIVFLRACFKSGLLVTQAAKHDKREGQQEHRLTDLDELFEVFGQASPACQPAECSFHNPAMGEDFEAGQVVVSLDDFKHPVAQFGDGLGQFRAAIAPVSPHFLKVLAQLFRQGFKQQHCSIAVLNIRRVDFYAHRQPQGVYKQMAFAALDFLARVVANIPPFSEVFTLWLSTMAAVGKGFLPFVCRNCVSNCACNCSHVPNRCSFLM